MRNRNYPLYDVRRITTLKELIDFRAEESPDTAAFTWSVASKLCTKTYSELKDEIVALDASFVKRNISKTKVAILGENSYPWILSFFSIVYGGNTAVPIDKELSAEDIVGLIKDSGCTHIVFSNTYSDIAEEVCNALGIYSINMEEIDSLISEGKKIINDGPGNPLKSTVGPDTLAAIIYTSGTTGISKGVMLSHSNFALDTYSACCNLRLYGNTLLLLPLHHSFGLVAGIFMTMLYGNTVHINLSLKNISRDLSVSKPQILFLVPLLVETLYKNIWIAAEKKGKSASLKRLIKVSDTFLKCGIDIRKQLFKSVIASFGGNLDTVINGGAPLNEEYIRGFRSFGINLLNGYGITECSPVVSVNRNNYYRDGSVGQVLNECSAMIYSPDEKGNGEICVKGSIVMQGYYGMKKATDEVVIDGWFHTGDLGYIDPDGFLYITGRKKNLIILSNGENVAPEELESLFTGIPLVKEIVVYEKEHRIVAEIYPDFQYAETHKISSVENELNENLNEINKTLPKYKQISSIILRDTEFEKTTTKKIKRNTVGGNR